MKLRVLAGLLAIFLLSSCGYISPLTNPINYSPDNRQKEQFPTNGEQIYFTATDQKGEYLSYTGGPKWGGMMMSSLSCASCHGSDGRGGTHYMHMQVMDAPAINYAALIEMKKKDSDGNPTEYSLDDLRGAVIEGHDTAGEQLNQNMPRWQMEDSDLADLYAFIKSLP